MGKATVERRTNGNHRKRALRYNKELHDGIFPEQDLTYFQQRIQYATPRPLS